MIGDLTKVVRFRYRYNRVKRFGHNRKKRPCLRKCRGRGKKLALQLHIMRKRYAAAGVEAWTLDLGKAKWRLAP